MSELSSIVLEGMISVSAALNHGSRNIDKIWIDRERRRDSRALSGLLKSARERNVPVEYVGGHVMREYIRGNTSGGVLAFASERRFLSIEELLDIGAGYLAALEGFEDPYNYGYAVRALYAAGFSGLLTSRKSWGGSDTVTIRASAGASEMMPTAHIGDYDEVIDHIKRRGIPIICTGQSPGSVPIYRASVPSPSLIVIGGEKRGIARQFTQASDMTLTIPYGRAFEYALPGASAVAVIAFELLRRSQET